MAAFDFWMVANVRKEMVSFLTDAVALRHIRDMPAAFVRDAEATTIADFLKRSKFQDPNPLCDGLTTLFP